MHTEWSAECGADDPVLVVPWSSPDSEAAFVDLRADPGAIDAIPEAEQHPALMQALRALNAPRSPVFTAKCDAWEMAKDEVDQLRLDLGLELGLDLLPEEDMETLTAPYATLFFGFAGYIDLVCCDRALFVSFPRHEQLLHRIVRLAASLRHPHAALECVVRPAFLNLEGPQQGFAISVYVKAGGASPQRALAAWAAALGDIVTLLRRRDGLR